MKLFLIRHAETIENERGIIQGQRHGTLSALGRVQAKKLGKKLKNGKFDFIYCSDLRRTKDTLKEILKYHVKIPVVYAKELRERHMGIFQGKIRDKVSWINIPGSYLTQKAKGGESWLDIKTRVKNFLQYLKKEHSKDRILIITHGGVIRICLAMYKKIPLKKAVSTLRIDNSSIFEINI